MKHAINYTLLLSLFQAIALRMMLICLTKPVSYQHEIAISING